MTERAASGRDGRTAYPQIQPAEEDGGPGGRRGRRRRKRREKKRKRKESEGRSDLIRTVHGHVRAFKYSVEMV